MREQKWSDEEKRKRGVADHPVGSLLCPLISYECVWIQETLLSRHFIPFSLGRLVDVPVWYTVATPGEVATPTPGAKRSPYLFATHPSPDRVGEGAGPAKDGTVFRLHEGLEDLEPEAAGRSKRGSFSAAMCLG